MGTALELLAAAVHKRAADLVQTPAPPGSGNRRTYADGGSRIAGRVLAYAVAGRDALTDLADDDRIADRYAPAQLPVPLTRGRPCGDVLASVQALAVPTPIWGRTRGPDWSV